MRCICCCCCHIFSNVACFLSASQVRLLIIDEVHLLNDERGPVIETLVARTTRHVGKAAHLHLRHYAWQILRQPSSTCVSACASNGGPQSVLEQGSNSCPLKP